MTLDESRKHLLTIATSNPSQHKYKHPLTHKFDRRTPLSSGTTFRSIEKKHGFGKGNWGSINDDIQLFQIDDHQYISGGDNRKVTVVKRGTGGGDSGGGSGEKGDGYDEGDYSDYEYYDEEFIESDNSDVNQVTEGLKSRDQEKLEVGAGKKKKLHFTEGLDVAGRRIGITKA
ncbi:hypothetical protein HDU76_011761 [Blyttiomyces sp. JEL0837]|nr:hypothetical protein HDU76_011761 [Blyttiomyces sp. JEL0837]